MFLHKRLVRRPQGGDKGGAKGKGKGKDVGGRQKGGKGKAKGAQPKRAAAPQAGVTLLIGAPLTS